MSETLHCEIVTPERKIYSSEVSFVALPGTEGEMGVMVNHAPLVTTLGKGEIRAQAADAADGAYDRFAVMGGYAEISGSKVIILATRCTDVKDADLEAARAVIEKYGAKADTYDSDDSRATYLRDEVEWNELIIHLATA